MCDVPFSGLDTDSLVDLFRDNIDECTLSNLSNFNFEFAITSKDKYLSKLSSSQNHVDLLKTLDIRNAINCNVTSIGSIPVTQNFLELVHLNVRSLVAYHEELEISLECLGYPSMIGLCET